MRYTVEQKSEALKLVDEIGAKKASAQLSIAYPTILDWRKKRKNTPPIIAAEEVSSVSPQVAVFSDGNPALEMQVQLLQHENTQLKTQIARQAKAIHALSPVVEQA